jgi:hypothetical protein
MKKYALGPEQLDQISDIDVAFSTKKFLPEYAVIPDDFKKGNTVWNRLFKKWFYGGLKELSLTPKDGIDTKKAVKLIRAHMGSFEPKHEHKEAGVAYMMSMLFDDAKWS